MINKVFSVSGNKIESMIIDEDSLKFSSKEPLSFEGFKDAWDKKLSLATKVEVKYESIKAIKKEENDDTVSIKYKTFTGIASNCEFSFTNPGDYEVFFSYFEDKKRYRRDVVELTPFKAIQGYILGVVITIGIVVFAYLRAADIANGVAEESHSRKARLFDNILGMLGENGVLGVGAVIVGYLLYVIWKRFSNPPKQIELTPPN